MEFTGGGEKAFPGWKVLYFAMIPPSDERATSCLSCSKSVFVLHLIPHFHTVFLGSSAGSLVRRVRTGVVCRGHSKYEPRFRNFASLYFYLFFSSMAMEKLT